MNSINAEKKYSRKGGSSTQVGASGLERVLGEDLAHSLGQDLMQGRKRFYIRGAASAKGCPQGAPEVTRSSKQVIVTGGTSERGMEVGRTGGSHLKGRTLGTLTRPGSRWEGQLSAAEITLPTGRLHPFDGDPSSHIPKITVARRDVEPQSFRKMLD